MRPLRLLGALLALLALALVAGLAPFLFGYAEARRDPVVRRAYVAVPGWPRGEPPRSVLLISDVHVSGPDMPPDRLARIVTRLNALHPDLVALTGDYISEKWTATRDYPPGEIVAALAGLRAPLGVVAVLGNHDHGRVGDSIRPRDHSAAFRAAFAASPVTLLSNDAVRRGPFRIGGIDDAGSGADDIVGMERRMAALGDGPALVLAHTPDILPALTAPTTAVLAGHTHCGQIRLPIIGPLATASSYGRRFLCGRIEDSGRTLFVTAGLGTSGVPVRIGVPPDVWLIRFGPAQ